jgi:hypothetical protein
MQGDRSETNTIELICKINQTMAIEIELLKLDRSKANAIDIPELDLEHHSCSIIVIEPSVPNMLLCSNFTSVE